MGTVILRAVVLFGAINFNNCYLEACEGRADVKIDNTIVSPILVNISNACLERGNSRDKGGLNFITTRGGNCVKYER